MLFGEGPARQESEISVVLLEMEKCVVSLGGGWEFGRFGGFWNFGKLGDTWEFGRVLDGFGGFGAWLLFGEGREKSELFLGEPEDVGAAGSPEFGAVGLFGVVGLLEWFVRSHVESIRDP
jgi:hypothetical protein